MCDGIRWPGHVWPRRSTAVAWSADIRGKGGVWPMAAHSFRRVPSLTGASGAARRPWPESDPVRASLVAIRFATAPRCASVVASIDEERIMVIVHVVAGSLALIAGMIALFARKGATWHRRSGLVFAIAMLVMTSTGAVMAAIRTERISILAGVLTFYLVCTGVLAVRKPVEQSRGTLTVFMLVAFAVAIAGYAIGFDVRANPKTAGWAPMFFVFASVAFVAALLDARLLWVGTLQGAHRLARHLWRMGFALLIANASFFLGQADLLPPHLRNFAVLSIPVLTVLLMTVFWLARVFWKRAARQRLVS